MPDRVERLDAADRWFGDGFRVIETPGGFALLDVDMTRAAELVDRLRARGLKVTYNHVIVRAAALALARHPEIHELLAGGRRLRPERVDIGLSVAGTTSYAPVMVVEDAGKKPLLELSAEIVRRVPEVLVKEKKDLAWIRRWGWLVPFGWLRRFILRRLAAGLWFRRKLAGTFQVSCSSVQDVNVPFLFYSAAVLGAGRVRDAVVAIAGQPVVRRIVTLAVCIDHKCWDGVRAGTFQSEMQKVLEQGELDTEAG